MCGGSEINGQPQSSDADLDLNTFKVQECWFQTMDHRYLSGALVVPVGLEEQPEEYLSCKPLIRENMNYKK